MWSRIDYIFVESLDKCVMITIYILMLFQDINWINDEKYHPCPRWFVLSSTSLLRSLQQKLVCVLCYTSSSLLPSICSSLPWSITIFYVKKVVRITPPLKNSWYGDTSHPHHSFLVPVLFLTGIPTIELWGVNSKLLATLLLWSNGRVSFKFFCSSSHHSNIDRATQPIFGCTFQPMFNCVCFPRAYLIISFDMTNVIPMFT